MVAELSKADPAASYTFREARLSTVNLPLKDDPLLIRPGVASESRVPVLQCWVNRSVTFAVGPIYYAPPLNSMAKGITGWFSRINRSVLSAAWKHRMRVSERHNSPAAAASRSAGSSSDFRSDFQVTRSEKNVASNRTLRFGAPCDSCLQVTRSNGAPNQGGQVLRACPLVTL